MRAQVPDGSPGKPDGALFRPLGPLTGRPFCDRGAVTSVEWCPAESSMLATTSADGSAAVWDLALERDPEEEAAAAAAMSAAAPDDLPPQLLFVHGGQGDLKEAHWHPQARAPHAAFVGRLPAPAMPSSAMCATLVRALLLRPVLHRRAVSCCPGGEGPRVLAHSATVSWECELCIADM